VEHAVALRRDNLVLGRYRPLRPLGSGGSGSVWLVRDEHSARDVALKVVPREGKAGSRAEREVEAAARLRHPHCLRALALERDNQHVYVTYEYVPGSTLREALRRGDLDDRGAVEAAAQVLEALAHAHSRGVVHRDVKPANVMLQEQGRSRGGAGKSEISVRVLDFGLAQVAEADTLTAAGDVPGTLAYIAPERLAGEEASGAADVWSVGVMLWEALAGRHPFWAVSPLETARRVAVGAPALGVARPDLPRRLCATVDRMLAVEPRRRPAPEQLAAALRVAWNEPEAKARPAEGTHPLAANAPAAAFAGLFTGGVTLLLPFFPAGWPFLLAALAAAAALARPRAGLAAALAAPILPLGNSSFGLAVAYSVLALAWLVLFLPDARSGLLFLLGPLLAPLGALSLVPVLVLSARGPLRRFALAAAAVLAAIATAALTDSRLPFTGAAPPQELGVAGSGDPRDAFGALTGILGAHPVLAIEALVLAVAAVTAALALEHRFWGIAVWGSGFLGAALLAPAGSVGAFPLTLMVWGAAALLAARLLRPRG
jgi:hypothetical protein